MPSKIDMGLYDSATGGSLVADKIVDFGVSDDGDKLTVAYTTAKRGRIAQIRIGDSMRVHYFIAERSMDEDADRIARWLCMNGTDALRLIRERA